jgi:hypothetical protein
LHGSKSCGGVLLQVVVDLPDQQFEHGYELQMMRAGAAEHFISCQQPLH